VSEGGEEIVRAGEKLGLFKALAAFFRKAVTGGADAAGTRLEEDLGGDLSKDELFNKARQARDEKLADLSNLSKSQQAKVSTVTGGVNVKTGDTAWGSPGPGYCAEDDVVRKLGGNPDDVLFSEAQRPRTGQEQPVCTRCQGTYSLDQFPPGTAYELGGPWEIP
jgi:hypothetical protein